MSADAVARLATFAGAASCRPTRSGHPLRNAVFDLESRLSRLDDVIEFSHSPDCVLRIAVRRLRSPVILVDARLEPGELVADLHYLNKHLPRLKRSGLAWGASFHRRMQKSFAALAVALEADPRLRDVKAVRGRMNSPYSRRPSEAARFAARFGLAPALQAEPVSLLQRAHELGDDLWFCALAWAYTPEALKRHAVLRWRGDVWSSRAQLLERYPPR